jgi:hypothetical protein
MFLSSDSSKDWRGITNALLLFITAAVNEFFALTSLVYLKFVIGSSETFYTLKKLKLKVFLELDNEFYLETRRKGASLPFSKLSNSISSCLIIIFYLLLAN